LNIVNSLHGCRERIQGYFLSHDISFTPSMQRYQNTLNRNPRRIVLHTHLIHSFFNRQTNPGITASIKVQQSEQIMKCRVFRPSGKQFVIPTLLSTHRSSDVMLLVETYYSHPPDQ
jgi:hypothetical protein